MYRIISHSYPNNEIRTVFSAVPNAKTFQYDEPLESSDIGLSVDMDCALDDDYSMSESCGLVSVVPIGSAPLSLVPNSKTLRYSTGYGSLPEKPTKFGLNAKRKVLRAGGALEKNSLPEECLFLTGTLPGSTEDSFKAIASYSAYLVNGLKAWIANYIPNKLDFYVWEYQKRGALHLHYCIHAPDDESRQFILNNFKNWWIGILHQIGEKSNCDLFKRDENYSHRSDESKVRAVAEICRKSPARYLAKYLTKSVQPKKGNARFFTPSRWFGVSRPLNALVNSLTKVTEIIVGSYHAVISKLEEVKYVCDSSESVTHRFKHKYGVGDTCVCYPKSLIDNEHLWTSLAALSTLSLIQSTRNCYRPSEVLKVVRTRLTNWFTRQLNTLAVNLQGLREYFIESLNMMSQIILSESSVELSCLMIWTNRILDTELLLKSSPCLSKSDSRMLSNSIDELENCMSEIILNGWS